jgi:putative colanic acid biosysnthesis UDP-glucose lipid carrier transferase
MPLPQQDNIGHGGHRGWVHVHSATLVELFRIVDAGWVLLGLWLASKFLDIVWNTSHFIIFLAAAGFFTAFAGLWPLYRSWRIASLGSELSRIGVCWTASICCASLLDLLLITYIPLPAGSIIGIWYLLTLAGLIATRILLRGSLRLIRRRGGNFRTAAILGANETGQRVAHTIQHTSWMGLRLVGFYDDRICEERRMPGIPIAGQFSDLLDRIQAREIDILYITLPLRAELRIHEMLRQLQDSTVTVNYVLDFTSFGLLRPHWQNLSGMPIVSLIDTPHQGIDAISKRIFDIIVSSLILVFMALPMLVIACAIKLTSKGPVLFRQKRYGLEGKEFEIWKFRSMTTCEDGKEQFTQATRNDARLYPLGIFLRRSSLDELPQFINVLQGRMSIVGPRPHPVALNQSQRKLIEGYMLRHKVKSGITGWAQINGFRGETDTHEKMLGRIQYDLEYINNWSLFLDIKIILLTIGKVFTDPNAY